MAGACSWAGCSKEATRTVRDICVLAIRGEPRKYVDAPYCSPHAAALKTWPNGGGYESTPIDDEDAA